MAYEEWYVMKPSFARIRTFISQVLVLNKTQFKKYQFKGPECISINYNDEFKGYRLNIPEVSNQP